MGYDYGKYMREYQKENLVNVSLRLNKKYDGDIIKIIKDPNNKESIQKTVKRLIRKGIEFDGR